MIKRNDYLDKLIRFKDKDLIKVITGIRRCGKSTLFKLYIEYLKNEGVKDDEIIFINLEDPANHAYLDYMSLYNFINEKISDDKKYYVFLDEVQIVESFQKAVDGLYIKDNVDVYITGSNAYLLSSELSTLLSGRYIEIKMLPLSFKEFINAPANKEEKNNEALYQKFISIGSFPYALSFDNVDDTADYIKNIFDSIMLKDIMARKKYPDYSMFLSVVNFMFDNIGNLSSTYKISNTLVSAGRSLSVHTIESYLLSLTESFILYKASRYDIKRKQYLKTGDKYYIADLGLRYFMLGRKPGANGAILENVVYLELLRRGYSVYVGRVDDCEVDFVAINSYGTEYYQVSETVKDENTLNRELKSLNMINDNYPKYLLTRDYTPLTNMDGIKMMNVIDWLTE